jgi:hypothetical protein
VGLRTDPDGRGKSRPHRHSNPMHFMVMFIFKYYDVAGMKLLNLLFSF